MATTGAVNSTRVNAPQAFVSSYAPRIRTYGNSLLTPVVPQTILPPVRTTKRGTTAINYAEEFDDDSIEDSDGPSRRATGLRTAQQRQGPDPLLEKVRELGKEAVAPVDVQGIWRDWMGKPKRTLTERQMHVQSALPTTLIPIKIDLDVAPFRPEAALPTPNNARDFGIDENLPAYKAPDPTPPYRLKDTFLWNLHEALITPDMFAKTFVDELDFPVARKQHMINEIAQQIRLQLEEHASTALHPLFQPDSGNAPAPTTNAPTPSMRPALSREESSTPMHMDTPTNRFLEVRQSNGHPISSDPPTPMPNGTSTPGLTVTAQPMPRDPSTSTALNPPDSHRCIVTLSINLQNRLYTDKFEWSLMHPPGFPEIFARQTCADIGLPGEWVPMMAHAIYEASLRLKKDMIDNNGTLAGVVGSGVDGWGVVENEACEYHGTAESALGVGAGWRFDEDGLGLDWEPKIEVLSKEEIEKREGDRERQIRRQRRETARFTTSYPIQTQTSNIGDYFSGGLGSSQANGALEDERMGRGERSKKKRRFRSLSPVGRDTPEAAGFGGTSYQLTEGERQYWTCSHCYVWGAAIWGVRDGPSGPRTLCNNCGLLYERDKRLPPWNHRLFYHEKNQGSREANMPAYAQVPPMRQPSHLQSDVASFPMSTPSHAAPPPLRIERSDLNPSSHLYTGASTTGGQGQISASTMADIINYAEPGEDLDWTQITEPRERKRLQNIINGRKYRERRLAAEGHSGSGGNYPGAAGVGSYLSTGYGQRQSVLGQAQPGQGVGVGMMTNGP